MLSRELIQSLCTGDTTPPLERFILHRLWELDGKVREAYAAYRFQDVLKAVLAFCSGDLSTLYFDVRKDALYCDRPDSIRRRACRTVMDAVFERLTAWLAPIATFTMEEAWASRFPAKGSNCLRVIPDTPAEWRNDAEASRWGKVDTVIQAVTAALEVERREKRIGGSLEAAPAVAAPADLAAAFDGLDPAEIVRTSSADVRTASSLSVDPAGAKGCKCERCWRILPEVKAPKMLCLRCDEAVADWDKTNAA